MRRLPPARRTACAAAAAMVGALLTCVVGATPALADEVYDRPADGIFPITGHGWGHGHGLSQWGAQGAASLGVDADSITAAYYPGTQRAVLPDAPIRVLLQADEGRDTQVYAAPGLTVTDLASGATATLPAGPSRWRATVAADGLHLSSLTGSTWTGVDLTGAAPAPADPAAPPPAAAGPAGPAYAGPLRFGGPTFVRVAFPDGSSRDYRGSVQSVATGVATLRTVDVLPLESYLLGVVPRESSASWLPAALQAQAIAARSYSAFKRDHAGSATDPARFDICDTTACQVFGGSRLYTADGTGIALEAGSTTDAVRATAGVVRTYGGAPIFAEFSSSNGGWSADGGSPYLTAHRDDWDGAVANPVHTWAAALRATDLQARYPAVGTLQRIRVVGRDGNGEWGGRVTKVLLEGVDGAGHATSVTATGAGIANARPWPASPDGLRSSWWHVTASTDGAVVSQSVAPGLIRPPGASTGRLTVTMRNTGTTPWPADGLHLAVASPPGQPDALVGNVSRPGVLTRPAGGIVAPGETADFSFALDAAGVQAGLHARAYRLRVADGPVFGAVVSWTVPVVDAVLSGSIAARAVGAWTPPGQLAPDVFADGRTVVVPVGGVTTIRLQVRNVGNVTWPAGPMTPVQLGTSAPRDRASASVAPTWLDPRRAARMANTADVPPGDVATFDLPLSGAGRPVGVSTESFEPVWDPATWVAGAVSTLTVVRVDPARPRVAALALAPPALVRGAGTIVVRLRNLGGNPWRLGREWLATTSGRPDPLRTVAWPRPTRPPALSRNVTRPGVAVVYPGEIGEWRIPLAALPETWPAAAGPLRESWQAIGPGGIRFGPVLRTAVALRR